MFSINFESFGSFVDCSRLEGLRVPGRRSLHKMEECSQAINSGGGDSLSILLMDWMWRAEKNQG